ncbi:RNA polymerase sigma-70 factor [Pedobacter psychrodurus]|uniref:RNA polymerase sigma-70 factor n=1 Tax=Pedobacter psychrodurus TaxID=2530456 RepID=A0A4V2MRA7_9SPHI|nr:RNA polymerase sigma-70 factor [Pedobacter psychrodurus]TCD28717.1 RNA polymerase sigma-70 factor [Pedobacter psychrodurus]
MSVYSTYGEDQLMALLRLGDELAFSQIYDRYWEKIFMLAANALDNIEEAEECVQDIFCSIWLRRDSISLNYSLYTYLAVAVKYRVINILDKRYRKRKKMAELRIEDLTVHAPSAEASILEKELMATLEKAIAKLPEKCRIVYRLSREEGKSRRQIAEDLNISEKTVNNHLTKALKDISKDLKCGFPLFLIAEILQNLMVVN